MFYVTKWETTIMYFTRSNVETWLSNVLEKLITILYELGVKKMTGSRESIFGPVETLSEGSVDWQWFTKWLDD